MSELAVAGNTRIGIAIRLNLSEPFHVGRAGIAARICKTTATRAKATTPGPWLWNLQSWEAETRPLCSPRATVGRRLRVRGGYARLFRWCGSCVAQEHDLGLPDSACHTRTAQRPAGQMRPSQLPLPGARRRTVWQILRHPLPGRRGHQRTSL